jgi:adenylate kinase
MIRGENVMRIMMLGPPGSGKGTHSRLLSDRMKIPQISVGDLLRNAVREGGPVGEIAKEIMSEGRLGPDDVIMDLVRSRLERPDCRNGYILDGFPRTLSQAILMDRRDEIDLVIYLKVPEEKLMDRLSSRRTCKKCGEVYNIKINPPGIDGICDRCGGVLYIRDDDSTGTIKKRMDAYENQTRPLIDYYRNKGILREVEGSQDIRTTFGRILDITTEDRNPDPAFS